MKVLFCTDGSGASFYAIKRALPFLHKTDEIYVISVIDWGVLPTYVTFPQEEGMYSNYKFYAEQTLERSKGIIESQGYSVKKSEYMQGQADKKIIEAINTEKYDLVVLGSHGKTGIREWLGSVSRKVATKSSIPILVVRPPAKDQEAGLTGTKDIVFAVDGSAYSYNAIKKTLSLLNLDNSSIEILTVKSETLPIEITSDKEWLERCLKKQDELAQEILEKAESILKEHNIPYKSALSLQGDPAKEILDYTSKNTYDLIVMGSHGRGGVSDFILGSVSKRILDHSISPVLIIPTKRNHSH